jgi:hypothetical protein
MGLGEKRAPASYLLKRGERLDDVVDVARITTCQCERPNVITEKSSDEQYVPGYGQPGRRYCLKCGREPAK